MRRLTALGLALAAICSGLEAQKPDLYDLDVVRDIRLTFSQSNWWTLLTNNYNSGTNIEATMQMDSETLTRVGVRFRGNTSYRRLPVGSEKKSFNIETDWKVAQQKIYGYDHLNLNNGFHDPTFVREVLMYQIMRRYGAAPKCNFVRLWLNNQFWGIYINAQQPNGDMADEWWKTGDGNRYRGFPTDPRGGLDRAALVDLGDSISAYQSAYQFKQGNGTDLLNLVKVLNRTPTAQLQDELTKVWSLDQSYWYMIVMNVMMQKDSYIGSGKDHYLYHDEWHGLFHMFPFDLNEGLSAEGDQTRLSPFYNSTHIRRPAMSKTLPFADWRARYVAHYRTVAEESQPWSVIGALATKYHKMIAADVAKDTKKIYSTQWFNDNLTKDVGSGRDRIRGLKPAVEARTAYLKTQSEIWRTKPVLSGLAHSPTSPTQRDTVWVTASASGAASVKLWSRARGRFVAAAMFDDGKHHDGGANDGVWGGSIAPNASGSTVNYYIEANTTAGVAAYLPRTAEFQAPSYEVTWPKGVSAVRLNEFMASNSTTIPDEKNQFDDWLELYNTSNVGVDIGGLYLTDDPIKPTKYQIPAKTVVPAGGTVLVWCDEDGTQGPLHANFKLSASGEDILFFAADGKSLLDSFKFGKQYTDVSSGRLYDGKDPWWATFPSATPKALNQPAAGHRTYSALDAATHPITLKGVGDPKIASQLTWNLQDAPSNAPIALFMAGAGANVPLPPLGCWFLLDNPLLLVLPWASDAQGAATLKLPIPDDSNLVGVRLYGQAFALDTNGWLASSAVETTFAKK